MDDNRRKEDKFGSPSTSSGGSRQGHLFTENDIRTKQMAEKVGVSNVLVLGMNINGVTYQGVLLPQKECKTKNT